MPAEDSSSSVSSASCAVAEAAPTTSAPANHSAKAAKMRMRMSDSSGHEAVMSQLAKRRSLSVPGFRLARSNLGLSVPTSLRCRSNAGFAADLGSRGLWSPCRAGTSASTNSSQTLGHVELPTVGCDRVAPVFLISGASWPGGSRHSGAQSAAARKPSTPAVARLTRPYPDEPPGISFAGGTCDLCAAFERMC